MPSSLCENDRGLVEALYSNPRVMVTGGIGAMLVALACSWQSADPVFVLFAALIAVSLALRLRATDHRAENETEVARRIAIAHGTVATTILGIMAFYAIHFYYGTFPASAAVLIALANAVGVAGRSFGSHILVRLQMASLCVPISLGFALGGDLAALVLAVLPILLIFATLEIADAQRATLDRAIEGGRRSRELAHRLSITLETTPGGIVMFDAGGRLRFANARACRVLDIDADDVPRSGGTGLDRMEVERRVSERLVPVPESGLAGEDADEDTRRRVLVSREDAKRVYRFVERSNTEGETVLRIDDVSALDRAERRVVRMARYDILTGLAARGWFFERGEAMLVAAERRGAASALVAVIDLDGLKQVNDNHGHAAGDAAIRTLASRIEAVIGDTGLVARLGGDEFALFAIYDGDAEQTRARIEATLQRLEMAVDFTVETPRSTFAVRGSCGVSVQEVGHHTLDELVERADFAQYSAKGDADIRLARFDRGLEDSLDRQSRLRADLGHAVANDEVSVRFRPLVDGAARTIGFEAVPRWNHAAIGPVEAAELMPLVGALDLDAAFLRLTLRTAADLCTALPERLGVTVRADARDVASGALLAETERVLATSGIAPERLTIQIEQTQPISLEASAIAAVRAVKELGVRLAIAGFGTGATGLVSLQRLPLDEVVLDSRVIGRGFGQDEKVAEVLAMARLFAERLGFAIAVDGVEDERDQAWLARELGYDRMRGGLFGPPLAVRDATELARRAVPAPVDKTEVLTRSSKP